MSLKKITVSILILFFGASAVAQNTAPSHGAFDKLLKIHVLEDGRVNYKGFIKDSVEFNKYLKTLSKNPPNEKTWSTNEIKAFWINAYNAFTIKLIIDNYPVKSIKDLGGSIYKVNTPWDIQFIKIGNETYDLNNIEHGKLRRAYNDPRIHFAVVCASKSCPKLFNEAFNAARLEQQLDQAGRDFLSNSFRNKITSQKAEISSIFKWYKGDFTEKGSLIDFLNKYAPVTINSNASISYLDYDWSLNDWP
ncbi:MAG TPA: DUF547 domain-containing protein [Cytophagales bacterium]|nr:DUF547 domain-containing protein [Cytophagales bacterium]